MAEKSKYSILNFAEVQLPDILEIQKNIEEKRLVLAQKIEKFLLKKVAIIAGFLKKILAAKSTAFFGSAAVIAVSVLVGSTRDLGHDSLSLIEGKNFSIIELEILANLIGILSLYFSYKILKKSEISKDSTLLNLMVLSFAAAFFLRVFNLQFNDFATSSGFLIALAFPYVFYHLVASPKLKNLEQILIGFLAGLIFCLKINYGILILVFELKKFLEKKSPPMVFYFRNLVTFLVFVTYLALFQEQVSSSSWPSLNHIFAILKNDIFWIFLISFWCFSTIKKEKFLLPFFLMALAAALILLSQTVGTYDQRSGFYSLSLPFVVLLIVALIKNHSIDWKRDGIFLLLILIIFQFAQKDFIVASINLSAFWPVFVLVMSIKQRHVSSNIFLPKDFISWIYFLVFALAASALFLLPEFRNLAWIFSALIFALMINFYQKSHGAKFSTLSSCSIFVVIAYLLALHLSAIFNLQTFYLAYKFKSPNHFTSEAIKIAKTNLKQDEQILFLVQMDSKTNQILGYLKKENQLPLVVSESLFKLDYEALDPLVLRLDELLKNKKNKLVFIEIKGKIAENQCQINFLEKYFHDADFAKIFLQNYVFLTRIIDKKPAEKEVKFFNEGGDLKLPGKPEFIERDVEIYVRK